MSRSRFHQHALRAAAAVAFTFTTVACGVGVGDDGTSDAGDAYADEDAGELLADAGTATDGGEVVADAGVCTPEEWETSYWECCEANGWVSPLPNDPQGCTPWGPPAPPSFRAEVV